MAVKTTVNKRYILSWSISSCIWMTITAYHRWLHGLAPASVSQSMTCCMPPVCAPRQSHHKGFSTERFIWCSRYRVVDCENTAILTKSVFRWLGLLFRIEKKVSEFRKCEKYWGDCFPCVSNPGVLFVLTTRSLNETPQPRSFPCFSTAPFRLLNWQFIRA